MRVKSEFVMNPQIAVLFMVAHSIRMRNKLHIKLKKSDFKIINENGNIKKWIKEKLLKK
mgnify:FL=1